MYNILYTINILNALSIFLFSQILLYNYPITRKRICSTEPLMDTESYKIDYRRNLNSALLNSLNISHKYSN